MWILGGLILFPQPNMGKSSGKLKSSSNSTPVFVIPGPSLETQEFPATCNFEGIVIN
jgi:hypothetical protein